VVFPKGQNGFFCNSLDRFLIIWYFYNAKEEVDMSVLKLMPVRVKEWGIVALVISGLLICPAVTFSMGEKYPEAERKAGEEEYISQGQFAIMLCRATGWNLDWLELDRELDADARVEDYTYILKANGIEPLAGWQPEAILTHGNMAVVLVKALGLEAELPKEELNNPQAYIDLLGERGIEIVEAAPVEVLKATVVNILVHPILTQARVAYEQAATPILPGE